MLSQDPFDAQWSPAIRRLFAVAACIARTPGIGFEQLREDVQQEWGRTVGISTLHKDIQRLKQLGLLVSNRHREGYYLSEFTIDAEERKALLGALRMQAEDLAHPPAQALYQRILKRFSSQRARLAETYPIEAIGQRVLTNTQDPLYVSFLEALRNAVRLGQAGLLEERFNPQQRMGPLRQYRVYPLQLVFHRDAWYVLVEHLDEERQRFQVFRLDRLHPRFQEEPGSARGFQAQFIALSRAKSLMAHAWELAMPARADRPEDFLEVVIAFDDETVRFLSEIKRGLPLTVEPAREGAIVRVRIPNAPECLQELKHWLVAWTYHARVLEPRPLADELARTFARAAACYKRESG